MFCLKEKIVENKVVKSIFEICLFILCLPVLNILAKSIFAIGQLVGTYTRLVGW